MPTVGGLWGDKREAEDLSTDGAPPRTVSDEEVISVRSPLPFFVTSRACPLGCNDTATRASPLQIDVLRFLIKKDYAIIMSIVNSVSMGAVGWFV